MNFPIRLATLPTVAILVLASAQLVGCGGEEEEAAPPARPVATGPNYSVQDISMDFKVQFPDKYTPDSESLAQAIADFASAMATGDHSAFGSMLAPESLYLHQEHLVPNGTWATSTAAIRAVRVVNIEDGESTAKVALAIGTDSEAYLTAWAARRIDGRQWEFNAIGVAPRIASRVASLDDAGFDEDALWLSTMSSSPPDDMPEEIPGDDFQTPDDGDDFTVPPSSPGSPSSPSSPFGG